MIRWVLNKIERHLAGLEPDATPRLPYRGLHFWDSEERCLWCRVDKMLWNDCQPCKGPEVRA